MASAPLICGLEFIARFIILFRPFMATTQRPAIQRPDDM